MTYITRIANKRILAKYFLYSLQINYLHCKLSASRSIFSCYATFTKQNVCFTRYRQDTEDNSEENHQLSVFVPLTTEDEQDVGIDTMESVARSSTPIYLSILVKHKLTR